MNKPGFALLQDVIMDEAFPDLDLALRRGRHVDREDAVWYALLSDGQEQLEAFYRRYGCELIHKTDGYFYLLPTSDKLSRRQLAVGDMLVGQALALLYLDPAVMERAGAVTQEELIAQLSSVLGTDALIGAFNPKRKRQDERIAHKNVRRAVAEAVRHLAALGFVEVVEEERLRLRPALMRFAEPVRAASEPAEALAKLAAQGEVAFVQDAPEGELDADGGEGLDEGDADEAAEAGVTARADADVSPDADADLDGTAAHGTAPEGLIPLFSDVDVAAGSAATGAIEEANAVYDHPAGHADGEDANAVPEGSTRRPDSEGVNGEADAVPEGSILRVDRESAGGVGHGPAPDAPPPVVDRDDLEWGSLTFGEPAQMTLSGHEGDEDGASSHPRDAADSGDEDADPDSGWGGVYAADDAERDEGLPGSSDPGGDRAPAADGGDGGDGGESERDFDWDDVEPGGRKSEEEG
ncbi:MAG: chromosome partition protein MukE [Polyangiales bacterium]